MDINQMSAKQVIAHLDMMFDWKRRPHEGKFLQRAFDLLERQSWNLLTEDADGIVHGLPGDDGRYLMTDGEDIWIDEYMDGVDDGIFLDSGRDVREIKAWMEMPELPKDVRQ